VKSRAMPDCQVWQGCGASPTGVGFGVAALPAEAERYRTLAALEPLLSPLLLLLCGGLGKRASIACPTLVERRAPEVVGVQAAVGDGGGQTADVDVGPVHAGQRLPPRWGRPSRANRSAAACPREGGECEKSCRAMRQGLKMHFYFVFFSFGQSSCRLVVVKWYHRVGARAKGGLVGLGFLASHHWWAFFSAARSHSKKRCGEGQERRGACVCSMCEAHQVPEGAARSTAVAHVSQVPGARKMARATVFLICWMGGYLVLSLHHHRPGFLTPSPPL
jgi:hypothetical protein